MRISLNNHKGGEGKTTSTINIGAGLSNLGKKVLLIHLDPRANLSQSLDITNPHKDIYGVIKPQPITVCPEISIIPSSYKFF